MRSEPTQISGVSRRPLLRAGAMGVCGLGTPGVAVETDGGVAKRTADLAAQGPAGDVAADDGGTLRRSNSGTKSMARMPTPESGPYASPDPEENATASEPGLLEGFTRWVVVFDDPGAETFTGAVLGGERFADGEALTLTGHASTDTRSFVGEPLEFPGERRSIRQ